MTLLIFTYHNLLQNDEVKNCYATYTFCIIFFETQLKFFYAIRTWQTSLVWKYNKMTLLKRWPSSMYTESGVLGIQHLMYNVANCHLL